MSDSDIKTNEGVQPSVSSSDLSSSPTSAGSPRTVIKGLNAHAKAFVPSFTLSSTTTSSTDPDTNNNTHDEEESESLSNPKSITQQIEYYFSNKNLRSDPFLLRWMLADHNHWVPINILLTFNKIKSITNDVNVVANSIKLSTLLMLSHDGMHVKRVSPLPPYDHFTSAKSCIHISNLPANSTMHSLKSSYSRFGKIKVIQPADLILAIDKQAPIPSLLNPTTNTIDNIVYNAFIEFENEKCVKKAIASIIHANKQKKHANKLLNSPTFSPSIQALSLGSPSLSSTSLTKSPKINNNNSTNDDSTLLPFVLDPSAYSSSPTLSSSSSASSGPSSSPSVSPLDEPLPPDFLGVWSITKTTFLNKQLPQLRLALATQTMANSEAVSSSSSSNDAKKENKKQQQRASMGGWRSSDNNNSQAYVSQPSTPMFTQPHPTAHLHDTSSLFSLESQDILASMTSSPVLGSRDSGSDKKTKPKKNSKIKVNETSILTASPKLASMSPSLTSTSSPVIDQRKRFTLVNRDSVAANSVVTRFALGPDDTKGFIGRRGKSISTPLNTALPSNAGAILSQLQHLAL